MSVSVVIPAYNEAETIGSVISACIGARLVKEVLVVSDGSTDATVDVARKSGAEVIELQDNVGKGQALLQGVLASTYDVVVFLDADLKGISSIHIDNLVEPVVSGACDMMIGLRDRSWFYRIMGKFLIKISGERVLHKSLFLGLPERYIRGFQVESALNLHVRRVGGTVCSMVMHGVTMRKKYHKNSLMRALWQYVKMWYAICAVYITFNFIHEK